MRGSCRVKKSANKLIELYFDVDYLEVTVGSGYTI